MANDKVFPKGIVTFAKNEKAPSFVLGSMVINLSDFKAWVNGDGRQYLTDYKGSPQLRLQVLQGKENRLSIQVDTYKPKPKEDDINPPPDENSDLPF